MATERFDLIVIGLGAMGAATAYQATARGLSVLGIDRFTPPHTLGSTHAETRITRLAVGEGEHYLPFVRRSHEIWGELAERTGEPLLYQCGGLIVTEQAPIDGQRWRDFVLETDRIAAGAGIDFTVFDDAYDDGHDDERQLPTDRIRGLAGKRVGYEPTAGLVMAERAITAQIHLAEQDGATVQTEETVRALNPRQHEVEVVTDRGRYRARHVVLATGPWMPELADPIDADQLTVTRQVVYWFEVDDVSNFTTDNFPFVMWVGDRDEDYVGIFPIPPGGTPGLKVLGEQFLQSTDPGTVERTVSAAEADEFYRRLLAPKIVGARPNCIKAEVCLYTNTVDDQFLIDRSPASERVIIMSPCSGHGFKHSAALGEAVAELVAGQHSTLDLTPFGRHRFDSPDVTGR